MVLKMRSDYEKYSGNRTAFCLLHVFQFGGVDERTVAESVCKNTRSCRSSGGLGTQCLSVQGASLKLKPKMRLSFQVIRGTCFESLESRHEKICLMPYGNNKGADQPAQPCSLNSTFVVHSLDR